MVLCTDGTKTPQRHLEAHPNQHHVTVLGVANTQSNMTSSHVQQMRRQYRNQLGHGSRVHYPQLPEVVLIDKVDWVALIFLGSPTHHPHLADLVPSEVKRQKEEICITALHNDVLVPSINYFQHM